MDFQYPLGEGLKANVLRTTGDHNSDAYRTLLSLGYSNEIVGKFNYALRFSGKVSVDTFLEHRPEFMEVGRTSMALSLVIYENRDTLFKPDGIWYQYLFGRMNTPFDEFGENKIGFVTFNYDRTLETYLFEALKHSYGKSSMEVADVLAKIPIVHVHGQLGDLPWQSSNGRPYKVTFDTSEIAAAAEGIRVVSEPTQIEGAFGPARDQIKSAERIVFIGFGYHRDNFTRLNLDLKSGQQRYYGSCFGKTPLELSEIEGWFKPSRILMGDPNSESLEFLRKMILL